VTSPGPIALALASAVVHAGWNLAFGRLSRDDERAAGAGAGATAVCCGVLIWTPVAAVTWSLHPAALPWAGASALAELGYMIALTRLYRREPVERGYPVARGLAPVAVLAVTAALGTAVTAAQAVGVIAVCAGVLLTARVPGGSGRGRLIALAAPVSACIATYTLLDSVGVRLGSATAYLWVTMTPVGVALLAGAVRSQGVAATFSGFRSGTAWITGAGIFLAYGLTLLALREASAAQVPVVAAVRETSVVMLPLLTWAITRSRLPARVIAGSWVILAGMLLLRRT
jgi:drug/metabolite transporter (DMT)-like permease